MFTNLSYKKHLIWLFVNLFPHSIEFDRDFDYFAIAGVTKKIKVLPLNNFTYFINIGFSNL